MNLVKFLANFSMNKSSVSSYPDCCSHYLEFREGLYDRPNISFHLFIVYNKHTKVIINLNRLLYIVFYF